MRRIRLSLIVILTIAVAQLLKEIISGGEQLARAVNLASVYGFLLAAYLVVEERAGSISDRLQPEPDNDTLDRLADDIAHKVRSRESSELLNLLGEDPRHPKVPQKIDLRFRRRGGRYREAGGVFEGRQTEVAEYYGTLQPQRMVILGEPGSGKTILAIELVLALLKQRLENGQIGAGAVPVRLPLSLYDPAKTLSEWIADQVAEQFSVGRKAARSLVAKDRILPILDGLDEIDSASSSEQGGLRHVVVSRMNLYSRGGEAAPLIVTCRTRCYEDLPPILDATEVEMQALQPTEMEHYLSAQFSDVEEELAWMDVLEILRRPDGDLASRLICVLSTPWMLTLAWLVCRGDLTPNAVLFTAPTSGHRDVRGRGAVRDDLLSRFVATTVGLDNARRAERNADQHDAAQVSAWLRTVSHQMALRHPPEADITLHTWWRTPFSRQRTGAQRRRFTDQQRVRLVHGSAAALLTAGAEAAVLASVPSPTDLRWASIKGYMTNADRLEPTFLGALIIVAVGTGLLPILAGRVAATADPRPSRLRQRGPGRRRSLRVMALTVVGGLCFGLLGGYLIKTASGFAISLELDLLIGGVGGTLAGLAFGAMHALDSGTHDAGGPLAVVRSDARYGIAYGLSVGSVAGAGTTIAVGPVYGLVVGLMSAVVFGMVLGPIAFARYLLAVALMRMRCGLPLRFGRFLEWAAGVGLMRKVGTSYQYRHREFHEWLER